MLFGDIKGFSKLREVQLPAFAHEVLGRFARVLDRHAGQILFCNTWGDGLYVVAHDALAAAGCALELQDEMSRFVPTQHQLPETMGLRLGGHVGPVFELDDPVLKRRNCMGVHVSRTARIEPVTPEGAVYVTEAFAAEVALARSAGYTCEYVGQVPAAKHYGTMRMYSLRRSNPNWSRFDDQFASRPPCGVNRGTTRERAFPAQKSKFGHTGGMLLGRS